MDGSTNFLVLAALVLAIFALRKASRAEESLTDLRRRLDMLAARMAPPAAREPEPDEAVPADGPPAASADEMPPVGAMEPPPPDEVSPEELPSANWTSGTSAAPPPARGDMEQALASRWFVWIGGVAIAIGGLLFVKYAYDNGLISPSLQIALGLAAAALLVAGGEAVRRMARGEPGYVPAAISAAGLATGFASVYAAYALYELIAPLTAFAGLAAIGLGALALSRLQGPFIAALGLVGSYVTPALIPSENPAAATFFPYLAVILLAAIATLRGWTWWWLGHCAIAGATVWALLWVDGGPFVPGDTVPVGLFALLMAVAAVFGLRGLAILGEESGSLTGAPGPSPAFAIGLVGLAAACVVLAGLVHETAHADAALALFMAAMALLLAIAWFKVGAAPLAPIAALLTLTVLTVWSAVAFHEWAMDERGLWSTVLGSEAGRFRDWMFATGAALAGVGLMGVLARPAKAHWAVLAGLAAVGSVAGCWGRADALFAANTWALIGALAAVPLLVVAVITRPGEQDGNRAGGILAASAALLLLFAIDRVADGIWMTLAVALLAAAYGAGASLIRAALMGPVTAALGSLAAIRLFVSRELWEDERNLPLGAHWPLYGYGVPVVLFLLAGRSLRAAGHARSAVAMEGLSLGLAISLASLELRVLINGGIAVDRPGLLEMSAHILTWAGAAYGLMHRQGLYSSAVSLHGARLLLVASATAIVLLSLSGLNPVVTEDAVPGNVVFNALLLAYLAPVALLGLIARRLEVLRWERLRPMAGLLALVLLFTYVTLETKRVFQGPVLVAAAETIAESYAYSAVWLALALSLFVAGIRMGLQQVRYAGLAVMVLVVLKVFLWDMSSLEGLYRIASFVGLGFCLVGIGWLYQRFVQKAGGVQKEVKP